MRLPEFAGGKTDHEFSDGHNVSDEFPDASDGNPRQSFPAGNLKAYEKSLRDRRYLDF